VKLTVCFALLAACKDHGFVSPPRSGNELGVTLGVTLDGKSLPLRHAYLERMSAGGQRLFLFDEPSSCNAVLAMTHYDAPTILLDLATRLAPDGALTTVIANLTPDPGARVQLTGSADAGSRVEVALDVVVTGGPTLGPDDARGPASPTLELHGTITADGCGDERVDPALQLPKAKHPSTATVTIAGKRLPIASAILDRYPGGTNIRDLLLLTAPSTCARAGRGAEVRVSRGRECFSGPPDTICWTVRGAWLERPATNPDVFDPKAAKLVIVPGATGTSADGPTVVLALQGAGMVGDYPIALAGSIEAIDCSAQFPP